MLIIRDRSYTDGGRHAVTENMASLLNAASDSVRSESRPMELQPGQNRTIGNSIDDNLSGIANDSIIGNPVENSTAVYMSSDPNQIQHQNASTPIAAPTPVRSEVRLIGTAVQVKEHQATGDAPTIGQNNHVSTPTPSPPASEFTS